MGIKQIGECSGSGSPGSEPVACHTCRDASAKVPLCLRPRSRQSKRLESSRQTASSFMLVTEFMATLTKTAAEADRKSTRLNSSHTVISYAVFCLKKKKKIKGKILNK